ncbi:hypothetical protein JMK10_02610 [Rhodovulum sulfidophilum]|uniref:hypothetical protein n=1 Tax=Rhodovulum sulfidophilum TaxID=35806 RepID=UPI001924C3CD|nr:hypothetical protein [Rhodovulum sulfidophilum]MBL3576020.1 hypothetical protein [Rhodovulum sulfidophilum]MCE8433642.1 hypothetical protein [Rhodovulum sulfidophilum]MCF4115727.1 hypothetical protein [Rhodovulum sulfidophilum]
MANFLRLTRALKMRNVPNNGWITLGSFASGSFVPGGVNHLTEAQAKDALSDIYGAVTGAILRAAILAHAPDAVSPGWHTFDMLRPGDGATGLIWSYDKAGSIQNVEKPEFEYGYEYALVFEAVATNRKRSALQISIRPEVTGTWSPFTSFPGAGFAPGDICSGMLRLPMPRQPRLVHGCIWDAPLKAGMEDLAVTTGAPEASALSAVRVRWAEGSTINELSRTGRVRLAAEFGITIARGVARAIDFAKGIIEDKQSGLPPAHSLRRTETVR